MPEARACSADHDEASKLDGLPARKKDPPLLQDGSKHRSAPGAPSPEMPLNTLIIAHRDELLEQAAEKYRLLQPDAIISKVGSGRYEYGGEVTVASIATISRPEQLRRLTTIGDGLVIVDEAHHLASTSYQAVLRALPEAFVLKVTATPDRLDGKDITNGKPPLYSASIIDLIAQGYLCDVKAIAIRTETSLDGLHTELGDYTTSELEAAVDTPARNRRVVEAYREHAQGRRAICFAVTMAHATHLAATFQHAGVLAALVCAQTPLDERKRVYKELRDGTLEVLTNVQVLTEGFDEARIDCIIMARPTQSRALFVQSIGRGLRLAPTKQDCLILDPTDNCLKHRLEPQTLQKALGKAVRGLRHSGAALRCRAARAPHQKGKGEAEGREGCRMSALFSCGFLIAVLVGRDRRDQSARRFTCRPRLL